MAVYSSYISRVPKADDNPPVVQAQFRPKSAPTRHGQAMAGALNGSNSVTIFADTNHSDVKQARGFFASDSAMQEAKRNGVTQLHLELTRGLQPLIDKLQRGEISREEFIKQNTAYSIEKTAERNSKLSAFFPPVTEASIRERAANNANIILAAKKNGIRVKAFDDTVDEYNKQNYPNMFAVQERINKGEAVPQKEIDSALATDRVSRDPVFAERITNDMKQEADKTKTPQKAMVFVGDGHTAERVGLPSQLQQITGERPNIVEMRGKDYATSDESLQNIGLSRTTPDSAIDVNQLGPKPQATQKPKTP